MVNSTTTTASTNEDYLADLKKLYQSAVAWGDHKQAYKISDEIESLQKKEIIAKLGQLSFNTARALFPRAIVINQTYYSRSLEIDGDNYRPNLHDSGHVTGWHCV